MAVVRAATRQSPLALWQTDHVKGLLEAAHPGLTVEAVPMTSAPDDDLSTPISDIGGKGAFAKEVQQAVLDGRADIAVHSAKDLPSTTVSGLVLAAVPERGDARDVLVGDVALVDLPVGAVIATGSNRRRTQLADLRPDLHFVELRGNIQRRVAQVGAPTEHGPVTAVIAAGAALLRQDLEGHIGDWLPTYVMTPQVGQGALAIECRDDDAETIDLVRAIEHAPSRRQVDAERSFLVALGGDCDLPAGAHATLDDDTISLRAVVAAMDASRVERCVVRGTDPHAVGRAAVDRLPVAELLG